MRSKVIYFQRVNELIKLLQGKQISKRQYNKAIKVLARKYREVDCSPEQAVFNQACEKLLGDRLR